MIKTSTYSFGNQQKTKSDKRGENTQAAKWSTKTLPFFYFVFFYNFFFLALRTYTSVDNISIYSYIHNEYVYIPVMHSLYILIFFTDM